MVLAMHGQDDGSDFRKRLVDLAGGLNPDNLKEAIEKVVPWGVDVHTGVENPDWSKNYEKIDKFIRTAKCIPIL